jgi:HlyD family secretion protein
MYPDVIVTEMTLTSRYPVTQIVARASGKISRLYTTDSQPITVNTLLAIIENPAKTEDVMRLKEDLGVTGLELGDIQPAYTSYLRSLHEYNIYYTLNYYPKKITATKGQITKYQAYSQNLKRQQEVMDAQFTLARQQYERDSLLHARGVISPSEHETARSTMLQSQHALEGTNASLENLKIQIGELETGLLDLELQQAEKESLLQQDLQSNMEQLTNAINTWELTYCLTSPIDGNVTFTNYWNENQYVNAGESVFSIVPDKKEEIIGKALLPIARSGKVKTGQRVIIRFNNFPDQEFGIVNGVVNAISLVPADNNYQVEIGLPDGLITNYNKTLPVTHEMKASAEIVTEDLRLIERFFMPLKQILKEGF